MSTLRFDAWKSQDGLKEYFKCHAWVNFNGTGTVAIRASGNVSSITDDGTGLYTVNFATALPSANYCAVPGARNDGNSNNIVERRNASQTASSLPLITVIADTAVVEDTDIVDVAIFS